MSAAATQTNRGSSRPRRPRPGWWLLARGLHAPAALGTSLVVVAAFTLIPTADVPVGILTADTPVVQPLYLLEPPVLAMLLARSCFSAADVLEATSPRRARWWHAGVLIAMLGAMIALLALQPNLPDDALPRALVSYLGCVGLTLGGAAALGAIGWLLPAAYVMLLSVFGATGFGEPAPWAWSLHPLERSAPIAAVLLLAGCAALAWRWARGPAASPSGH